MRRTGPLLLSIFITLVSLTFMVLVIGFKLSLNVTEERQSLIEGWINQGYTEATAEQYLDLLIQFINSLLPVVILLFVLSIVLMVLSSILKPTNNQPIATTFIIISILHLLMFRIISFILILWMGLRIKKKQIIDPKEELQGLNPFSY